VSIASAIILVLLLALVLALVSAPLRAASARSRRPDPAHSPSASGQPPAVSGAGAARAELETAREAKYREIRDAELDFRTGKLSREDYAAIDAALRAEALEILDRLERPGERGEDSVGISPRDA
jgi:hypothetical protein